MQEYEVRFWLPRPRSEVFAYLSDVRNLDRMTPDWLRFHVLTPLPVALREGTMIDYRLRWRGIPLPWRSEITAWRPASIFTYEQRRGPYRRWLHEHRYEESSGGTLVIDRVVYSAYGGRWLDRFVAADVRSIFEYRIDYLKKCLGPGPGCVGRPGERKGVAPVRDVGSVEDTSPIVKISSK